MESEERNPLGDFLRARRAQIRPKQVGLATCGQRRVPVIVEDGMVILTPTGRLLADGVIRDLLD